MTLHPPSEQDDSTSIQLISPQQGSETTRLQESKDNKESIKKPIDTFPLVQLLHLPQRLTRILGQIRQDHRCTHRHGEIDPGILVWHGCCCGGRRVGGWVCLGGGWRGHYFGWEYAVRDWGSRIIDGLLD